MPKQSTQTGRAVVTSSILPPPERRIVEAAAERAGQTVSMFVRTAAVERALDLLTPTKPANA